MTAKVGGGGASVPSLRTRDAGMIAKEYPRGGRVCAHASRPRDYADRPTDRPTGASRGRDNLNVPIALFFFFIVSYISLEAPACSGKSTIYSSGSQTGG